MTRNFLIFSLVVGLILTGILSRIIPHLPNFTAVGATALFAGAVLRPRWLSYVLPLVILWVSDLMLNNVFYKAQETGSEQFVWFGNTGVYLAFVLITWIGYKLIPALKIPTVLMASVTASMIFFLVTNFWVWKNSLMYSRNLGGLISCYVAGLPFFWNTLVADMVFSAVLFSIYFLLLPKLQPSKAR